MTPHQIEVAKALGACTFLPASSQKRFARNMAAQAEHAPGKELSEKQDRYLTIMAWRYRRQMPASLVPAQKPEGA